MSQTSTSVDGERRSDLGDGVGLALGHGLDIVGGAIEFLVLTGFAGEEDETGLVGLQALDVYGEGFLRVVRSSCVDCDADCGCEFARDTGFL